MQLGGVDVGSVVSVEGGEWFGVVVEEMPVGVRIGKHLGSTGIAPIVVEVGASMTEPFHDWMTAMLDGTPTAKDGAILFLDYDGKERSRLEWQRARITEVVFPAADSSSKDPARIRVTIQPESTKLVAGSGAVHPLKSEAKGHKAFLPSNFRFAISGLGAAGTKVSKVAPTVVRWRHADDSVGDVREDMRETNPGVLEVADLVVWLPERDVAPFAAWFEDFVIDGNGDSTKERTASLTFLDPTLKDELMRLEFAGVGIFRISHERQQSGSEAFVRVKAEMYCEAVSLAKPAATTPPPKPRAASAVESLASALVAALRAEPVAAPLTADAVTERLLASVEPALTGDERHRGHAAGRAWASEHARLDELEDIAALAARDHWTALALAEGHSMVTFLARNGDFASNAMGPIDLNRDDFTGGLVAGAAELYREIAPRLREHRPPTT
jgi:hypothetical protein